MAANSPPMIEASVSVRERIFHLIEVEGHDRGVGRVVNLSLLGLIIANVLAVILETVQSLHSEYAFEFEAFEVPSVAIFSLELKTARYSHAPNTLGGVLRAKKEESASYLRPFSAWRPAL